MHKSDQQHLTRRIVDTRRKQFEEWLAEYLYDFRSRAEGHILRIPRLVRDVTLHDFARYNGNIQECLKGMQRDHFGGVVVTIDKSTRKRKWIESQETEAAIPETGRDPKNGMFILLNLSLPCLINL